MTDKCESPRLAALRSLEASLLAHRQAEEARAAQAACRSERPPSTSRVAWLAPRISATRVSEIGARVSAFLSELISRLAVRLRGTRPLWVRPRARRAVQIAAALAGVFAIGVAALGYRLSSGPIALDFATDWL